MWKSIHCQVKYIVIKILLLRTSKIFCQQIFSIIVHKERQPLIPLGGVEICETINIWWYESQDRNHNYQLRAILYYRLMNGSALTVIHFGIHYLIISTGLSNE